MKRKIAVTIRQLTSPSIREYSCENIAFNRGDGEFFTFPLNEETLKSKGYKNLTNAGKKLLNGLAHIVGINRVFVGEKDITVVITNGYHWGYINSDIVHAFEHTFGRVKIYEEYKLD